MRRDLLRFLRFVEQIAPLRCGYLRRFTDLDSVEQDHVLEALAASSIDALRAGFDAMKGLVMLGYYRDARTFRILGYRGPLLAPSEAPDPSRAGSAGAMSTRRRRRHRRVPAREGEWRFESERARGSMSSRWKKGVPYAARFFNQREEEMIALLFQDRGARMTEDFAVRVLMGRGVGGSTIHNTNLCKRTPPEILDLWARKHHSSVARQGSSLRCLPKSKTTFRSRRSQNPRATPTIGRSPAA